jgi:hypothetical protein
MTRPSFSHIAAVSVTAMLAFTAGCSSSPPVTRPITEPVIDQPGEFISRYQGPELELLVSSRVANARLGEEWLVLQVGVGGMESAATEVRRDAVSVQLPDGERIPIMSHQAFSSQYSEIAGPARAAAIAAEPLDFTRGNRRDCTLDFMPLPGTSIVRESRFVTMRDLCQGLLYFRIPGGVQPGRYELRVELEERKVDLPFEIR